MNSSQFANEQQNVCSQQTLEKTQEAYHNSNSEIQLLSFVEYWSGMNKQGGFITLSLYVLLNKACIVSPCAFSKVSDDFVATVKFRMFEENEEICILACYEESDCTFVVHAGTLCVLYREGNKTQTASGTVFKLDRQILDRSFSRRVKIGSTVAFPKYSAPIVMQGPCEKNPSIATTTISMYKIDGVHLFTNKLNPTLPDGSKVPRRIFLAKEPQSKCEPLPVFTRANHRRLYFGSVFNVTGYYFLDGYAFANYCECDDGGCCGVMAVKEADTGSGNYNYILGAVINGTELDQPVFVESFYVK